MTQTCLSFVLAILFLTPALGQNSNDYQKYQQFLDEDAELLLASLNVSVEKSNDSTFWVKYYHVNDSKECVMIAKETFVDEALTQIKTVTTWDVDGQLLIESEKLNPEEKSTNHHENKSTYYDVKTGDAIPFPLDTPRVYQVFKVVERMPRFPGCEQDIEDHQARKACADKKMIGFTYDNINFPETPKNQNIEGTVVLSFIVNEIGFLDNITIARKVHKEYDLESKRIAHLMNATHQIWAPGTQRERLVKVLFMLPLKFRVKTPTAPIKKTKVKKKKKKKRN